MQVLRCPRCGTRTYEGHFTYPVCHKCHENLSKCRYCRFFPGGGRYCKRAAGKPVVFANDVRACPHHRSVLLAACSSIGQHPVNGGTWVCLILTVVFALVLTAVSMFPASVPLDEGVKLLLQCPRVTLVGEEVPALLQVQFPQKPLKERDSLLPYKVVRVRLNGALLDAFDVTSITPSPVKDFSHGNKRELHFRSAGEGDVFMVGMKLLAKHVGEHLLKVEVFINHNDDYNRFQWFFAVASTQTLARNSHTHPMLLSLSAPLQAGVTSPEAPDVR